MENNLFILYLIVSFIAIVYPWGSEDNSNDD